MFSQCIQQVRWSEKYPVTSISTHKLVLWPWTLNMTKYCNYILTLIIITRNWMEISSVWALTFDYQNRMTQTNFTSVHSRWTKKFDIFKGWFLKILPSNLFCSFWQGWIFSWKERLQNKNIQYKHFETKFLNLLWKIQ